MSVNGRSPGCQFFWAPFQFSHALHISFEPWVLTNTKLLCLVSLPQPVVQKSASPVQRGPLV